MNILVTEIATFIAQRLGASVEHGPARSGVACVGNQHKWDRLGPEKIIIMKSCVGAP